MAELLFVVVGVLLPVLSTNAGAALVAWFRLPACLPASLPACCVEVSLCFAGPNRSDGMEERLTVRVTSSFVPGTRDLSL
jgi:hypothetical protein